MDPFVLVRDSGREAGRHVLAVFRCPRGHEFEARRARLTGGRPLSCPRCRSRRRAATRAGPVDGVADMIPIVERIAAGAIRRWPRADPDEIRSAAFLGLALVARRVDPSRGGAARESLVAIAARKSILDALRSARAAHLPWITFGELDPTSDRGRSGAAAEARAQCREILERMPTAGRELLERRAEGWSFADLAAAARISPAALAGRYAGALAAARRLIA